MAEISALTSQFNVWWQFWMKVVYSMFGPQIKGILHNLERLDCWNYRLQIGIIIIFFIKLKSCVKESY